MKGLLGPQQTRLMAAVGSSSSQRPQETRERRIMVIGGSGKKMAGSQAGPLGVAADLCGGLGLRWSHKVAAGSTSSSTEHHTKGPLFPTLSIYSWPAGLHRPLPIPLAALPGPSLLEPTQRLVCPCRASLALEDPVHRELERALGWVCSVRQGLTSMP